MKKNKLNTPNGFGSYVKKNRKNIVNAFYKSHQMRTDAKYDARESQMQKIGIAFITLFTASLILFWFKIPAALIIGISSFVTGGIYLVNTVGELIERVIDWVKANNSYQEVVDIAQPLENKLQTEVKPVLSSYLLTNQKGQKRNVNMIVNSNLNQKDEVLPGIVNMILEDGTVIVAYQDDFIDLALYVDELIFTTQYEGYEVDMKLLHRLIKDYIEVKPDFKETKDGIDPRESILLHGLGEVYVLVKQKADAYTRNSDAAKRIRKPEDN